MSVLLIAAIALAGCRTIAVRPGINAPPAAELCRPKQPGCERALPEKGMIRIASGGGTPFLMEAAPGQPWFEGPHIGLLPEERLPPARMVRTEASLDVPGPVGNLILRNIGLFSLEVSWTPSGIADADLDAYIIGFGTGVTADKETDIRYWQSTAKRTQHSVNMKLVEGQTIIATVYALDKSGAAGTKTRSAPLTVSRTLFGQQSNVISYTLATNGVDASGNAIAGWNPEQRSTMTTFMDGMFRVLYDLYGPPATSQIVRIVRDPRYVSSAIYFPGSDEILGGDTMSLQLLTHELVHAWRNDRVLSSGPLWQYDTQLSAFEEAFAHALAYEAMTEYALRHPEFGLTQQLYQSSTEWTYDFENVPELRTNDLWSNSGGTQLHWKRYEMAAAALQKIQTEHPGFYRRFNAAYYARLNADPTLTSSRELIIGLISQVAPTIEDMPAKDWIEQQHVFGSEIITGPKVWRQLQLYPRKPGDFYVFNRIYAYETFPNGSDWAWKPNDKDYVYHSLNGITGTSVIVTPRGNITQSLRISPTQNPTSYMGYGFDEVNLTTATSLTPWPGGNESVWLTRTNTLALYPIQTTFYSGTVSFSNTQYVVMGDPLRDTNGIWGGIIGASSGQLVIKHRSAPLVVTTTVSNGAFHTRVPWASRPSSVTESIDSIPGLIDFTFINSTGARYTGVRSIIYGSWLGNQAFLFGLKGDKLVPGYAR